MLLQFNFQVINVCIIIVNTGMCLRKTYGHKLWPVLQRGWRGKKRNVCIFCCFDHPFYWWVEMVSGQIHCFQSLFQMLKRSQSLWGNLWNNAKEMNKMMSRWKNHEWNAFLAMLRASCIKENKDLWSVASWVVLENTITADSCSTETNKNEVGKEAVYA